MSHVTDVILVQDGYFLDWEAGRLALINQHLSGEQDVGVLVSIDDEKLRTTTHPGPFPRWYGGRKRLQSHVAMGAFNGLDIPRFLEFLKNDMPWNDEDDGSCQVLLKDEHDCKYSLHDIFDGPLCRPD